MSEVFTEEDIARFEEVKVQLAKLEPVHRSHALGTLLIEITKFMLDSEEVLPITEVLLKTSLAVYASSHGYDEDAEDAFVNVVSQLFTGSRKQLAVMAESN